MRFRASAVAAACMAICFVTAASAQTVKLGVINTYSGPFAAVGELLDRGIRLYVKQHEKDLPPGVKLEIIRRDDTGPNPEVAKRMAQELITRDHVQLLAGADLYAERAGDRAARDRGQGAVRHHERRHRDDHHEVALHRAHLVHACGSRAIRWATGRRRTASRRCSRAVSDYGPGHRRRGGVHQGLHRRRRPDRRLGAHAAAQPRLRAVHAARQGRQARCGVRVRARRQGCRRR